MRVCDRKHFPEIPSIFSYCSGLSDIQTKGSEWDKGNRSRACGLIEGRDSRPIHRRPAEGRRHPRPLRLPHGITDRRPPRRDRGTASAIRILPRPPTQPPAQGRRHAQHVLDLGHRLDVGVDVERNHGVSLHVERLYKPPWRATIHALPKNMRKIERRLSLPNRGNDTRKSAGKLTISRGADGAEAGVGKMIGRIYRDELAVCNLNCSAVCFAIADAVRNVPKCVRIGAARLYTLAFGCQLICDQPETRRRLGSSNSDFPLGF